jgi:hypothetical protein
MGFGGTARVVAYIGTPPLEERLVPVLFKPPFYTG